MKNVAMSDETLSRIHRMTHPTPDAEPMLDLAAILARADAATPGPWVVSFPEIHSLGLGGHPTEVVWQMPFEGGGVEREADATFIAAARTDVPALVDALRVRDAELAALRAERDALAKRVADLEDTIDCGCNALTDSIMASGNHPRTNLHWVAKIRRALAGRKGEG